LLRLTVLMRLRLRLARDDERTGGEARLQPAAS
jgi:hypothetical protein